MKIYLVTGAAGFIGFHLSRRLIENGIKVIGIDNLSNYYDINLKKSRLENLERLNVKGEKFIFYKTNLENYEKLNEIFLKYRPEKVINLAAQAGVRYSLENPSAYIQSNLVGFNNVLECCRHYQIKHLVYASSSSVYGGNTNYPFSEHHSVDHPVSLYAATKKSNELMAHTYSHLYSLPSTGLRFFTVYGPWGRPDMALFLFTKAMIEGKSIDVFNKGEMVRDFTYIDDIIESLVRVIEKPPQENKTFNKSTPDNASSWAPYRIFNIGNSSPTPLMAYIKAIETALNIVAKKNYLPMQPGDVKKTSADTSELEKWINYKPNTSISYGVKMFVNWYKDFYNYLSK